MPMLYVMIALALNYFTIRGVLAGIAARTVI